MAGPLTQADSELRPILQELLPLEPIFHTRDFGLTRADFEKRMAPDYWEVGASGRCYSPEFILDFLAKNPPVDAASAGWRCSDHAIRQLGPNTYLLTYALRQGERLTRRSTVWQKTNEGWCILYHQGTIAIPEDLPGRRELNFVSGVVSAGGS
jgi:hypothetical protein